MKLWVFSGVTRKLKLFSKPHLSRTWIANFVSSEMRSCWNLCLIHLGFHSLVFSCALWSHAPCMHACTIKQSRTYLQVLGFVFLFYGFITPTLPAFNRALVASGCPMTPQTNKAMDFCLNAISTAPEETMYDTRSYPVWFFSFEGQLSTLFAFSSVPSKSCFYIWCWVCTYFQQEG